MKALVGDFKQVIVQPVVEPMEHYTALLQVDPHGLSLAYRGHGGQDPLIPIRIDSKGGGSAEDN